MDHETGAAWNFVLLVVLITIWGLGTYHRINTAKDDIIAEIHASQTVTP